MALIGEPMEQRLNYFIGRQPILNGQREIIGFELLFRAAGDHQTALYSDQTQAAASVITSMLSDFGLQDVLGDKYGFINITEEMLNSEAIELLPAGQTILELLESIKLDDATLIRCCALKALGFKIALDDHAYNQDHADFYNLVDIVKIDLLNTDIIKIPEIAAKLKRYPVQLLAERVETMEVFELCRSCGFDLFQGFFFERPAIISHKRLDASAMATMKLLKQLNVDADIDAVEDTFRENPELTFQLLKLVNSVMTGTRDKIKSIRHSIMILGVIQLRRWVQLSLYAGKNDNDTNSPLLEMAAVRGRLMEQLILQQNSGQYAYETVEAAFFTGILSLLDALYETSMDHIIASLNLSSEVAGALLHHEGILGQLLLLTRKLEHADLAAVQNILGSLPLSSTQLRQAQLEAFKWRHAISGADR
jgi:EAL and modified HD-GYP domain-containing signal transduction protein